ncbi:alpha-ketoacid dehydrogenase subunit beta [Chloroflexota bacterium]
MSWDRAPIDLAQIEEASPSVETERGITYRQAIKEALTQALAMDDRVFIMGEGVDDAAGIFGTTLGLQEEFGEERVFDVPIAENGITGVATGAALAGMYPIVVHQRMDFLLLAMDQIVNHAAKWHYMFGGKVSVPLTIRSIIGGGWGSAAQHSQSLQGLFLHVPGLKIVMPSTPYDVKGLLISSIFDRNPIIFIEHRWLYDNTGHVPEEAYRLPIGKGAILRKGTDLTIVAVSYLVPEAMKAAATLEREGVDVEVVDPRTLKPLDEAIILKSTNKTGRLVVADIAWKTGGVSAEIAALIAEKASPCLKVPIKRVTLPDVPTPASSELENVFYPREPEIISASREVLSFNSQSK